MQNDKVYLDEFNGYCFKFEEVIQKKKNRG